MSNNKRLLQKEQTRALLMETAYALFSQNGIMNTRMSDIAVAAGVSHGTVFAHFENQEALISNVIETYGGKIALRTHELGSCCQSMAELLSAHLDGIREFEPFYTRLVIENHLLPTVAKDVWVSIQSAISFHFSQVAEKELQTGKSIDLPAHMLFNVWIGLVHYYLINGDLFAPNGSVMEQYHNVLIESYLKLIHK